VKCGVKGRNINLSVLNEDEQNQKGIHKPREGRPKAPERGERERHDKPPSSCHRRGRSEAVDTLTMISPGVEISIAGGGGDEKDARKQEACLLFLLFFISYIGC